MACATSSCALPPSPISPRAANVTTGRAGSRGCKRGNSSWVAIGCKHPMGNHTQRMHSTVQAKPDILTVCLGGTVGPSSLLWRARLPGDSAQEGCLVHCGNAVPIYRHCGASEGHDSAVAKSAFGGQIEKSALGKSMAYEPLLSCFR